MADIDIFFFRHGQTDYNARSIIQGQSDRSSLPGITDQSLNALGAAQARCLAAFLRDEQVPLDVLLSSDLKRAFETGQAVAAAYGNIPLLADAGLREMFFGADNEGLPVSVFKSMTFDPPLYVKTPDGADLAIPNGAVLRDWHKSTDPAYDWVGHPGGETKHDVRTRAMNALIAFAQTHPHATHIGVPTHNGLLRFVMPELTKVDHTECVHAHLDIARRRLIPVRRMKPPAP